MVLESILDGIQTVAGGDALLPPVVTRRLIGHFTGRPETATAQPIAANPRRVDGITEREREVLTLTKLDARDRVHLVIIGYELGLVAVSG